jgi:Protein of unknown function (DUF1761)
MHSQQDHLLPVLVAALVQWIIGGIWYGLVFKKSWRKLVGATGEANGGRAVFAMGCSFIASLILSLVLVTILHWAGSATFFAGAALAIICWLGFMAPPLFVQHIHERRPVNLFAINAAYWMISMAVTGGMLAVWR